MQSFNVNELAARLGDTCYVFLALNFLWGLYCVILLWRRIIRLRFPTEQAQVGFLEELQGQLKAGDFAAAEEQCSASDKALPQLALMVLANRSLGYDELRQMVAELLQRDVMAALEYKLGWIATVIKSGPLLGLFGTVLGMMASFGRIGTGEKVQPDVIAKDIAIALICTAMGLATAIPFGYVLASLNIRVRNLQESLSSGLTRFLEYYSKHVSGRTAVKKK